MVFLLLSPLLKFVSSELEQPLVILLHDNTGSLAKTGASGEEYQKNISAIQKQLSEKYTMASYTFAEHLNDSFRLDFSGKETDISAAIEELSNLYENRNVGAIILASDGIYNKGINPLYAQNKLKVPIYTIALGDTTVKRDLFISKVNHNQLAYLNNIFPIEVIVQARKLQGKRSRLSLLHEGKLVGVKEVEINQEQFLLNIPFELKAEKTGIQRYTVQLEQVQGEEVTENNRMDFFIEVLDSRQKILVLAEAPDPDVGAIRMSLRNNQNYEMSAMGLDQFQGNLKQYGLVILHQIPGQNQRGQRIISEIEAAGIPVLYIAGAASALGALNTSQQMVQFNGSRGSITEAQAVLNKDFALFTMSDELRKALLTFDPLQVPYANYQVANGASVMFRQKIGSVETAYPMLVFQGQADRKSALLLGTGIWRWRLQDFAEHQNHQLFDEFFSKVVQYLCVRNDQRNFRLIAAKSFFENEDIQLEAEVYNASYELVNEPDVLLKITDTKSRTYPFTFSRSGKAYRLNAGRFPEGEYRYEARVNLAGKEYVAGGQFIVKPVQAELIQTQADHGLMRLLATRSGGKMLTISEIGKLPEMVGASPDLKPISHSEIRLEDLISLPWIFFFLLLFLALEWGVRKWQGGY